MAADQLNKRYKVSNAVHNHHTSWEMQKVKRKKFSHYESNTKSRISLEWDDKKECVVSKKEQISIASRELTPFLPLVANYQNALGDVFTAPTELFELNNLTGLLSYEVWQTHLTVQEREFLTQFLPEGADPYRIVHELLTGNNFYFGNPFPKWGASICSGDYHPDAVLRQEQCNKANKLAYYSELNEYHTKMIGSLQLWKEKWASCTNPENFMQNMPRPRRDFHKSGPSHDSIIQYGPQHDIGAASGSCSWDADAKSYYSESPDLSVSYGETLTRVSGNKCYESSGGRSVTRPKKGDKLRKLNMEYGDGAKYMSYIKVSKEQHERVKSSMKQSNTSIQPRSLNNVLGNLDSFCVQPYEVFEEEERQKLHEHWLHLAKKDLCVGFENWKSWRAAKRQIGVSLRNEMEDKWKSSDEPVLNLYNNRDDKFVAVGQDEEQEQLNDEQHVEGPNDVLLIAPEENIEQNGEPIFQSESDLNTENHEITNESSQLSDQNQPLPQISIPDNTQDFCHITINTNDNAITGSEAFPSSLVEYPEDINHANAPVGEPFPTPAATTEIWPPVSLPNAYYHLPASVSQDYPSISQSSFLHRRSDVGDSFYNPYVNPDRNELQLHSLFKDPGNSHYLGTGQSLPLDQNMFADGGDRYLIPRHEHLLPLNQVQDWSTNSVVNVAMSAPSHHHHHHRLGQNWFSEGEGARDGWVGGVVPSHDIRNGGQVVDESLFSVLSGLRSGIHYGSTEFIQPGSYIGVGREPVLPTTTNGRGSSVNYMSGNEGELGWMNM
ncbi:putative nuclear factor related to kappa-B-binding protein [Helianthus annuus]|nr:putative nuclear factor related to kappa-B-binding protein [Helianthus annuus]